METVKKKNEYKISKSGRKELSKPERRIKEQKKPKIAMKIAVVILHVIQTKQKYDKKWESVKWFSKLQQDEGNSKIMEIISDFDEKRK